MFDVSTLNGLENCEDIRSLKGKVKSAILVDFSWLLHKSFYAYDLSTNVGGVEVSTGDIYGVLRALGSLIHRKPFSAVFICLDGSTAKRKQVCPSYKAGREDTNKSDIYLKQKEMLEAACILPGVYITYHPDYEADDVMGTLARVLPYSTGEVLIYASDKDLYQCVNDQVRVITKFKGNSFEYVDLATVQKKMKVPASDLVFFRALTGDKSDNLEGYPRIPKKLAIKLAGKFKTPQALFNVPEINFEIEFPGFKKSELNWVKKIRKDPGVLERNFYMMKLMDVERPSICRCTPSWTGIEKYALQAIGNLFKKLLDEAE